MACAGICLEDLHGIQSWREAWSRRGSGFSRTASSDLKNGPSQQSGEKSRGGRSTARMNKELLTKLNNKEEACVRWEQGEATWEEYRDAAQTSMHGLKKGCVYYC